MRLNLTPFADTLATVARLQDRYRLQVGKIEWDKQVICYNLERRFGDDERAGYGFGLPSAPGITIEQTLVEPIAGDAGQTFATRLLIEAGKQFGYYLRFSHVCPAAITITILGRAEGPWTLSEANSPARHEANMAAFCQAVHAATRDMLRRNPLCALSDQIIAVNEYTSLKPEDPLQTRDGCE